MKKVIAICVILIVVFTFMSSSFAALSYYSKSSMGWSGYYVRRSVTVTVNPNGPIGETSVPNYFMGWSQQASSGGTPSVSYQNLYGGGVHRGINKTGNYYNAQSNISLWPILDRSYDFYIANANGVVVDVSGYWYYD